MGILRLKARTPVSTKFGYSQSLIISDSAQEQNMLPAPESNKKIPYILLLLAAKETSSIEVYGKMTISSLCSVTLINSFLMSLRDYSLKKEHCKL